MKLSEIKGEKALEVVADLIDPITLILADNEFIELYKSNKPKILVVKKLLKTHQKETLTILALLNDEDPETYKPSIVELPKMLLDIFNDEELKSLFTLQTQKMEGEFSGSATESTEE